MKPLRTLITPVVIAALAAAGLSATPAHANNEDLAKILLGIGAIALIAKAAENNRTSATVSTRNSRVVTLPERKKPKKNRVSYALPEQCLRTYNASRRDRQLYSGRCLTRVPYKLAKLPEACSYTIKRGNRTIGKAYGPRCLARNGFYQVDSINDGRRDRHIVFQN